MFDYFRPTKYLLDRVWFDYLNVRYSGRGSLTWDPATGFRVEAFLNPEGQLPPIREYGRPGPDRRADVRAIRMKLKGFDLAIAPNVRLRDRMDIAEENHLSVRLDRVLFLSQHPILDATFRFGSADLKVARRPLLPDVVRTAVTIDGDPVGEEFAAEALRFQNHDDQITIRVAGDGLLRADWSVPSSVSKAVCWRRAESVATALSVLVGQNVRLLQREIVRIGRQWLEVRRESPPVQLGHLALVRSADRIDKETFVSLMNFFDKPAPHADAARKVLDQVSEAVRQENFQTGQLLVATLLEAFLRSVDGAPFQTRKRFSRNWDLRDSLESFRARYFDDDWREACDRAIRAHFSLRDRNAHPDWLIGQGGQLSDAERAKALDEMVVLCQFYGYMILALAGRRNLRPRFLASLRAQPALLTIRDNAAIDQSDLQN